MILNTRQADKMTEVLKSDNFLHPVCFDPGHSFASVNPLPTAESYHTFLLNSANEIVAVGNPSSNPKVRNVYRQIIAPDHPDHFVKPLCRRPVANLGLITTGDTITKRFQLRNVGDTTLTVQALIPSCGCVSAEVSNTVIRHNDVSMVTVKFLPDSTPGFIRRHVDIYYNEIDKPERLTLHGLVVK